MYKRTTRVVAVVLTLLLIGPPIAAAQTLRPEAPGRAHRPGISISGDVALASLMALGDGYLQNFADSLTLFAHTPTAQTADWDTLKAPLTAVAQRNVDALVWFALPDGTYWSVQAGLSSGNLSDRAYFPRVLAGDTVVGDLVISKATGRSSAIVAVPITIGTGVVGVLGASVYLDHLSARLDNVMALGGGMIFYSFDATPLLALEWDPQLIFVDPFSLGPEIRAVFEYMLSRDEGSVRYRWAGQWRTVIFRRSVVTGWWYVFGVVEGGASAAPR